MSRRAGIGATTVVLGVTIVFIVGAIGFVSLAIASPRIDSPSNTSSNPACNLPSHVTNLAAQVEQDPRFVQAAAGMKYALVAANDDGAGRVTFQGKTYSTPPKTNLVFYSDGSAAPSYCPLAPSFNLKAIVGVMWVHVPQNADGSYDLTGMTIYHTAGLLLNGTSIRG